MITTPIDLSRFGRLCFLGVVVALPIAGCGSRGSRVPLYKVHGKVLANGSPATGAIVVLNPLNNTEGAKSPRPRGVVGKDGEFVVGSRMKDDGAPEGDYAVTIVWPEEEDPTKQFDNTPPDRLENRYNDLNHPQWNIRVTAGMNTLETFNIE
jgi:hypothetical protein